MEKQIEEMAKHLIDIQHDFNEYCAKPCRECELGGVVNCESFYKAEKLTAKGYRKASDVAREIFAEIEENMTDIKMEFATLRAIGKRHLAKIKEKYESEE